VPLTTVEKKQIAKANFALKREGMQTAQNLAENPGIFNCLLHFCLPGRKLMSLIINKTRVAKYGCD
jgi:hypothetical protein